MIGAAKIVRDIARQNEVRKRAEELQLSLAHLSRISTMSQMASVLAHELSQPLGAMTNYISAAIRIAQQDPADRDQILTGLTKARSRQDGPARSCKSFAPSS